MHSSQQKNERVTLDINASLDAFKYSYTNRPTKGYNNKMIHNQASHFLNQWLVIHKQYLRYLFHYHSS